MNDFVGKHIWIIGASSGIGAALARRLAAKGATLALSARNRPALDALALETGLRHSVWPLDVSNAGDVRDVANALSQSWPRIDSVIVMAGTYTPQAVADMNLEDARRIIDVNLMGSIHVIHAILPVFHTQGYGQIALCGSVAGYRGLPQGQPYSATKAAIINMAESLRAEEQPHGIDVRLICPGFVHTPMTAKNTFVMPMAISADEAAMHIACGLLGRDFEIHFPRKFTWLMKILRAMPDGLFFKIAKRMKT